MYVQQVPPNLCQLLFGCDCKTEYTISTLEGHPLLKATEESSDMMIEDVQGNAMFRFNRQENGCTKAMEVCSAHGNSIGSVYEECAFLSSRVIVKDEGGNAGLRIEASGGAFSYLCDNHDQYIISRGSNQVGQISKAPSAAFLLQFPMNLDVKMKALLLGAAFLIDAVEQATDFCNVLATLSGEEEGQRNWLMQMQGNARQG